MEWPCSVPTPVPGSIVEKRWCDRRAHWSFHVTWSVDYNIGGTFVGLSVNSGPCQFYGSRAMYATTTGGGPGLVQSRTFNWVVFPSDGPATNALHRGTNTFTLCGGGMVSAGQSVNLFNNTLSVRISQ